MGRHLIAEFCGADNISDPETVREAMVLAAKKTGATVLGSNTHDFGESMGVTGVVLLSESHISIHSWPELGYAALDIFVCGNHVDPYLAIESLKEDFTPAAVEVTEHRRGTFKNAG
ncbi:S-adenosylmethionine decarboxylase proenzyme [Rhodobacteraceae bacterium (ex Bugula neritina AB1)]|nr:S-adenosylmethionine decarboxylase proenzyme [Rhodobacteraceae bacterium (ex Bugula neritina AB1)]